MTTKTLKSTPKADCDALGGVFSLQKSNKRLSIAASRRPITTMLISPRDSCLAITPVCLITGGGNMFRTCLSLQRVIARRINGGMKLLIGLQDRRCGNRCLLYIPLSSPLAVLIVVHAYWDAFVVCGEIPRCWYRFLR
jgi:hypothetical protein